MARRFVVRGGSNKITGSVRWPHADFPEEIDDQDADYIAYLAELENPPDPKKPARDNLRSRPDNYTPTIGDLKAAGLL